MHSRDGGSFNDECRAGREVASRPRARRAALQAACCRAVWGCFTQKCLWGRELASGLVLRGVARQSRAVMYRFQARQNRAVMYRFQALECS